MGFGGGGISVARSMALQGENSKIFWRPHRRVLATPLGVATQALRTPALQHALVVVVEHLNRNPFKWQAIFGMNGKPNGFPFERFSV